MTGFDITVQCNECPWRKDVEAGRFAPERFELLQDSVQQGFGAMFACHKSKPGEEMACVGYLLSPESNNNFLVRMSHTKIDRSKLVPTGPQYESFEAMATANGVMKKPKLSDAQTAFIMDCGRNPAWGGSVFSNDEQAFQDGMSALIISYIRSVGTTEREITDRIAALRGHHA